MKRVLLLSLILVFAFLTIGCASTSNVQTDQTKTKKLTQDEITEESESSRAPSFERIYNPQFERR